MQAGIVTDTRVFELQAFSNCWICEGWSEYRFTFEPGVSDGNTDHDPYMPIKLHLEIDRFQPDLLLPSKENKSIYEVYRMLPPGSHKYYFSVGNQVVIAKDHIQVENDGQRMPVQEKLNFGNVANTIKIKI